VTLLTTPDPRTYNLTNFGTITLGTGTATFNIDGTLTNYGEISGSSTGLTFNGNLTNIGTVSLPSVSAPDFNEYSQAIGSLTNENGATMTLASNPVFTVAGSFIIDPASTFPANATLTLDGNTALDTTVDASGYAFATPVTINRTTTWSDDPIMTIATGTTLPLGDNATVTLNDTYFNDVYTFINFGTITTGTGTFTWMCNGPTTNYGTIRTDATAFNSSTITHATGSLVEFRGDGRNDGDAITLTDLGVSYDTLRIAATDGDVERFTLGNALTVSNDLTLTGGTLNLDGYDLTVNDLFVVGTGTTLRLHGDETITGEPDTVYADTTIWYDDYEGTIPLQTFEHKDTVIGSTGSVIYTIPGTGKSIGGNLTISGGTLKTTNAQTLTLSGSFVESGNGTFSAGSGTLKLAGTASTSQLIVSSSLNNLTLNNGLVGYWKLDDGPGSTVARDDSGYGNHGTLTNYTGVQTSTGWVASPDHASRFYNPYALEFDGMNDAVISSAPTVLAHPLSVNIWFRTTHLNARMTLWSIGDMDSLYGHYIELRGDADGDYVEATSREGFGFVSATTTTGITSGQWHMITALYASNTDRRILIDGGSQGTNAIYINPSGIDTMTIGENAWGNGGLPQYFKGTIDDVRVYNRILEASEIAALAAGYQNTGSGVYTLGSALTLSGDLHIISGVLKTQNSQPITLAGDWNNVGGFTSSGTVTLNAADGVAQTVSGSTVFGNFTKMVTAASTLFFDNRARQSFSGSLNLMGVEGGLLSLKSTKTGSAASLLLDGDSGTQNIRYVDVKDNDASGGMLLDTMPGGIDSGNTTNWYYYREGTGSILGTVWNDSDGDGTKDDDELSGLNDVTIDLTGNTATGAAIALAQSTTSSGAYSFTSIIRSDASGYTVSVNGATVPAGYLRTTATSTGIVLGTGAIVTADFGFVQASTLTGTVFFDTNANGLRDDGENSVFSGAVLNLTGTTGTGGTLARTVQTNASGAYLFDALPTSMFSFLLVLTLPDGYEPTISASRSVTIAIGGTTATEDIGLMLPAVEPDDDDTPGQGQGQGGHRGKGPPIIVQIPGPSEVTPPGTIPADPGTSPAQPPAVPGRIADTPAAPDAPATDGVRPGVDLPPETPDNFYTDGQPHDGWREEAPAGPSLFDRTTERIAAVGGTAGSLLLELLGAVQEAGMQTARTIVDIGNGTATMIANAVSGIGRTTVMIASTIADAIGSGMRTMIAGVQSTSRAFDAGIDNFTHGLIVGMESAGNAFIASVDAVGNGIHYIANNAALALRTLGVETVADTVEFAGLLTNRTLTLAAAGIHTVWQNGQDAVILAVNRKITTTIRPAVIVGRASIRGVVTFAENTRTIAQTMTRNISALRELAVLRVAQRTVLAGEQANQFARAFWQDVNNVLQSASQRTVLVGKQANEFRIALWMGVDRTQRAARQIARNLRVPSPTEEGETQHAAAPATAQSYRSTLTPKNGRFLIASLHLSITDNWNVPFTNTPVVLFSVPKVAVTNEEGIATFHDVETGKHELEIHLPGGFVESRQLIVEPPSGLQPDEVEDAVDVVLPVIQVKVQEKLHGSAGTPAWLVSVIVAVSFLALSNSVLLGMYLKRRR